jgi:hypothetical protein
MEIGASLGDPPLGHVNHSDSNHIIEPHPPLHPTTLAPLQHAPHKLQPLVGSLPPLQQHGGVSRQTQAASRGVVLPTLDTTHAAHTPAARRRSSVATLDKSSAAHVSGKAFQVSGKADVTDSSLDVIFNHVSTNMTLLAKDDPDTWKDFDALTKALYNKENSDDKPMFTLLAKYGFKPDSGWAPLSGESAVNLGSMSEALGSMYLAEKSKSQESDAVTHIHIKNFQSLSFLPNVVFSNFGNVFNSKPSSVSFESAVLLADISGFSKFAGSKCSTGLKGLDELHKITSEFLGLFVRTVYDHGGDGKNTVAFSCCCSL